MPETPPPPVDPRPFGAPPARSPSGCQKPLLIGCGTLALLLGIGAIVFVIKAKEVLAFAMNQLRAQVVSHLPADATGEEKRRLEAAFEASLARIRSGELDPVALQRLQRTLTSVAQEATKELMSRAQLAELQGALDAFNAAPAPGAAPGRDGSSAPAPESAAPSSGS